MKTERNKSLMITSAIVLLIAIIAIVAVLLFNINAYKSEIETAVSGATGLDVRITGKMVSAASPIITPSASSTVPRHAPARGVTTISRNAVVNNSVNNGSDSASDEKYTWPGHTAAASAPTSAVRLSNSVRPIA